MKRIFILVSLLTIVAVNAQNLPENPESGKCYISCKEPEVYENRTETLVLKPAHKVLRTVPATYKTVTERILIKPETKKMVIVPAKWGTETVPYSTVEAPGFALRINPAVFKTIVDTVVVREAHDKWEQSIAPDCASSNPEDCRYWCYNSYPAEIKLVERQVLANDAASEQAPSLAVAQTSTYEKQVLLEAEKVIEETVPAVYDSITRRVIDKPASTVEELVPAVTEVVTKEVLVKKGGMSTWKKVECTLLDFQLLPISWNLGSATLTDADKRTIDTKLLPVLTENSGARLEIASHTDSRGSSATNQALSEKRAKAVVDYLVSKGINSSLLIANGYGEQKLINRCANGVSCTEREHQVNRRTEFRLLNNGQ